MQGTKPPEADSFLARDAFVRAIAMMFVRLFLCLFVWDGRTL